MATTKSIDDLTTISILLDASHDLWAASYANDDAAIDDFRSAYQQCADHITERSGVTIDVTYGRADGPESQGIDHDADRGIWQAIHDCLRHDEEEGWVWMEGAADDVADKLAAEVAEEIATLIVADAKEAVRGAVAAAMEDESDTLADRVAEILADRLDD